MRTIKNIYNNNLQELFTPLKEKVEKNIKKKEIDEFKCDLCQRIFYRKWVNAKKTWSKINEISYWLGGKELENYKIVCRACLDNWFEKTCRNHSHLITPEKKKRFQHYRYIGLLNSGQETYKE